MTYWKIVWCATTVLVSQIIHVSSHGRMIQPAQRSSAWRFGFDNPVNGKDHELYCGGFGVQWNAENDGKCGACGDPYNAVEKPNEDVNGKYVKNGVITGNYIRGDVIETKVRITAYHKGWFEFRLCPLETFTTKVTQACLNRTLLREAGSNKTRFDLDSIIIGTGAGTYVMNLQLPSNITCARCVLQWKYNAGNSWGYEHGKGCLGCGKQENFVNCADIGIAAGETGSTSTTKNSSSTSQSVTMSALTSSTTHQTSSPSETSTNSTTVLPSTTTTVTTTTSGSGNVTSSSMTQCSGGPPSYCKGAGLWASVGGMGVWCCNNCRPGYCPDSHCSCTSTRK